MAESLGPLRWCASPCGSAAAWACVRSIAMNLTLMASLASALMLGCGSDKQATVPPPDGGDQQPTLRNEDASAMDSGLAQDSGTGDGRVGDGGDADADRLDAGADAGPLPGDECPPSAPVQGDVCPANASCTYDACDTTGTTTATCSGGMWTVTVTPCAPTPCPGPPSDKECQPGEICLISTFGDMSGYLCKPNTCGTGPIVCRCGAREGAVTCINPCVRAEGHEVECAEE
jgi:hypothetical protein